jgi:hypothetical protein
VLVVAQIHHEGDVLKELKCIEKDLEGIEVLTVGFDGSMLVKVTADTIDRLKERVNRLRQINYCAFTIKGDTFET